MRTASAHAYMSVPDVTTSPFGGMVRAPWGVAKRVLWGGIRHLPVRERRQILYRWHHGRWADLGAEAELFTEKMQRRILFDHRPLIGDLGDKLKMKQRAAQLADVKIPRTFWCGVDLDELASLSDFPSRWVLKPNNGSGQVILGEGRPDIAALKRQTRGWLTQVSPLWRYRGEWIYSTAKPGILLEERLGGQFAPADYKFFVFHGDVGLIVVHTARFSDQHQRRYYTPDWKPLEIRHPDCLIAPVAPAPRSLDRMLTVASKIGADFDFIRVDLYDIDGEVWFGELTPYHGSGLDPFEPLEWDRELGRRWRMDISA
jgi:TupA-like ATPgrasp